MELFVNRRPLPAFLAYDFAWLFYSNPTLSPDFGVLLLASLTVAEMVVLPFLI